jgi:hypothetical protein
VPSFSGFKEHVNGTEVAEMKEWRRHVATNML